MGAPPDDEDDDDDILLISSFIVLGSTGVRGLTRGMATLHKLARSLT